MSVRINALSVGNFDDGRYNPDASGWVETGAVAAIRASLTADANWEVSETTLGSGGTTASFTLGSVDVSAPVLSASAPADNAGGVAVAANIAFTFSENVQKGVVLISTEN